MDELDQGLVDLANGMLGQLHVPLRVRNIDEINHEVFVTLFEGLYGEQFPDIIRRPRNREDEVHNCQCVIDALSMDILHTSLSHLTGEDVVSSNHMTIGNLLEIFSGLLEYILNKIESDVASETETEGEHEEDEDALSPRIISDAVQKEMQKGVNESIDLSSITRNRSYMYEHIPTEVDKEYRIAHSAFETTDELIQEGEVLKQHLADQRRSIHSATSLNSLQQDVSPLPSPLEAPEKSSTQFDHIGVRPQVDNANGVAVHTRAPPSQHTFTHHLYHHWAASSGKTTQPPSSSTRKPVVIGASSTAPIAASMVSTLDRSNVPSRLTKTLPARSKIQPVSQKQLPPSRRAHRQAPGTELSSAKGQTKQIGTEHKSMDSFNELSQVLKAPRQPEDKQSISLVPERLSPVDKDTAGSEQKTYHSRGTEDGVRKAQKLVDRARNMAKLSRDAVLTVPPSSHRVLPKSVNQKLMSIATESEEIEQIARTLNLPDRDADCAALMYKTSSHSQRMRGERADKYEIDKSPKSDLSYSFQNGSLREVWEQLQNNRRQNVSSTASNITMPISPPVRLRRRYSRGTRDYASDGDVESISDDSDDQDSPEDSRLGGHQRSVHFDEFSPDIAPVIAARPKASTSAKQIQTKGHHGPPNLEDTNRRVHLEDKRQKIKTQFLREMYEAELADMKHDFKQQIDSDRRKAKDTEKQYRSRVLTSPQIKKHTGMVRSRQHLGRGVSKSRVPRRRSVSASPCFTRQNDSDKENGALKEDMDLLSLMLEEFPHLYLSPETWHELWRKGISQIDRLTRSQQEATRRKTRAQVQVEDAERRQEVLLGILKKELSHQNRMRDINERKTQEITMRNRVHEKRMQSAQSRKYYNDYCVQMRHRMVKRRTKEEMMFRKLFQDGLSIQKERIREIRRYAKEQRNQKAEQRQNELDSLENYYREQFEMLAETMTKEREELHVRESAQSKVLNQMKRALRVKMEHEIKNIQEQLLRDEDDVYFRQLDADRVRNEISTAKYNIRA